VASALPPVPAWRLELRRAPLDPTAKLVGFTLSTYMDGAGRAQVSRSTLAAGCGLESVTAVKRAVRRLELAGLLGVDRAGRRQHLPSRYQARCRGGWPDPPEITRGVWSDPADNGQGGLRSLPGGSPGTHELEGLEGQDRSGEGYGSDAGAQLAREAAAAARRAILGGEP